MVESRHEALMPFIRLLEENGLRHSKTNAPIIESCLQHRWVIQSPQKSRVEITEKGLESIPEYLSNFWPQWSEVRTRLLGSGYDLTVDGLKMLGVDERAPMFDLPVRAHSKTLAACLGIHSKAKHSRRLKIAIKDTISTSDNLLRIRANRGLRMVAGTVNVLCDDLMGVLGEIAVPERAFLDGFALSGNLPKFIVSIENLGAFVDFPQVDPGLLIVHSPGNDTSLTLKFLELLSASVQYSHFGDLDPKGLEIAERLSRQAKQSMHLFVPDFWAEFIEPVNSKKIEWPKSCFGSGLPIIVQLRELKTWLEQEIVVLDSRFENACKKLITG
jgi:hypothetical protein